MSVAFYRKYRSKNLGEVVGQKHITEVLEKSLKQGKIAHAYLFTGPRGVGKTSIARILAHQINDLPYEHEDQHPDIIEIDAASNNGVDEIRNLRDQIQVVPFSAKFRVYIIDEVHMLSKAAFNALLKTLEEPPAHAIFILATTDAHKIPTTIVSRTQQFVFRYISRGDICAHLRFIADSEKVKITDEALEIIAERGGGSFRDSISLLDQLSSISSSKITTEKIEQILGLAPKKQIHDLIANYETQNASAILAQIEEIRNSGVDLRIFTEQFVAEIKNLLGEKPHLVKLLSPLQTAKNSNFLELELLSILIEPGEFKLPPAQMQPVAQPIPQAPPAVHTPEPKIKKEAPKPAKKEAQPAKQTVETSKEAEKPVALGERNKFNWHDFLQAVKKHSPAIGGILSQSGHEFTSDTIKIYTGVKIKKSQLDKAQNRTIIAEALAEVNAGDWLIETLPTQKPPVDADAAKVFEIMGGGEEVEIDEQFTK